MKRGDLFMYEFIQTNFWSIIVVLVALIVICVLFFVAKGKYRKVAKSMLLSIVVTAERRFGDGTGEIKFAYVAEKLYETLPPIIQLLFTEKDIANLINEAVEKMKAYLTDNPQANSIITGETNNTPEE
jgi:hypothetical protein